jgi:hypothetical protein
MAFFGHFTAATGIVAFFADHVSRTMFRGQCDVKTSSLRVLAESMVNLIKSLYSERIWRSNFVFRVTNVEQ